jgi:hypothetical protein
MNDFKFWLTPPELYKQLDDEFHFDFDPCPFPYVEDGIYKKWGKSNYVNPPFLAADAQNGHDKTAFIKKAIFEMQQGNTTVLIIPVPSYLNLLFAAGAEIRPAGRVKWVSAVNGQRQEKPPACALFILRGKEK